MKYIMVAESGLRKTIMSWPVLGTDQESTRHLANIFWRFYFTSLYHSIMNSLSCPFHQYMQLCMFSRLCGIKVFIQPSCRPSFLTIVSRGYSSMNNQIILYNYFCTFMGSTRSAVLGVDQPSNSVSFPWCFAFQRVYELNWSPELLDQIH